MVLQNEVSYLFIKNELPAAVFNSLPHGSNDLWQLIGTNMRMSFVQDFFIGTKVYKKIQDTINISTFATTGVQLAIAVSACPTLPKTVIAFGVYNTFFI